MHFKIIHCNQKLYQDIKSKKIATEMIFNIKCLSHSTSYVRESDNWSIQVQDVAS